MPGWLRQIVEVLVFLFAWITGRKYNALGTPHGPARGRAPFP